METNKMFCYQCEQTAKGVGCTIKGVCGKEPDVAAFVIATLEAALKQAVNFGVETAVEEQ